MKYKKTPSHEFTLYLGMMQCYAVLPTARPRCGKRGAARRGSPCPRSYTARCPVPHTALLPTQLEPGLEGSVELNVSSDDDPSFRLGRQRE